MLKLNGYDGVAYEGNYHPAEIALSGYKAAGWKHSTKTGTALSFDDTYNDTVDELTVRGKSEQTPNNLIKNGDFSNGTADWSGLAATLSAANNTLIVTGTGALNYMNAYQAPFPYVEGKKIFVRAKVRFPSVSPTSVVVWVTATGMQTMNIGSTPAPAVGVWHTIYGTATLPAGGTGQLTIRINANYASPAIQTGSVMEVKDVVVLDVTTANAPYMPDAPFVNPSPNYPIPITGLQIGGTHSNNLFDAEAILNIGHPAVTRETYKGRDCIAFKYAETAKQLIALDDTRRHSCSGWFAVTGDGYLDGYVTFLNKSGGLLDNRGLTTDGEFRYDSGVLPVGTKYIWFAFSNYWDFPNAKVYVDINSFMLNEGVTPLPYEPYGIGASSLNITVNGTDYPTTTPITLHSLPDGTADTVDLISGVGIQSVGVKVFDGTETGWYHTRNYYPDWASVYISGANFPEIKKPSIDDYILCSHIPYLKSNINPYGNRQTLGIMGYYDASAAFMATVPASIAPTLADWKSYLAAQHAAGTPVTVLYKLAAPQPIALTPMKIQTIPRHTDISADGVEVTAKVKVVDTNL